MLIWVRVGGRTPGRWPLPAPTGLGASPGRPVFGPEYARRLDIFARNLAHAQRLQEEDLGTAEFGVTAFSDLTGTGWGSRACPGVLADGPGGPLALISRRGTPRTKGLGACPKSPRAGAGTPEACVPAQLKAESRCRGMHCSKDLGLSVPPHPCLCVSQGIMGTQMAKDVDGWSGRSRIWGGVNIVILVVPSVPQRRSLTSCMGIRGQLEGPPMWTER